MEHQVRDMTSGKPLHLITAFSVPLLFGNILQQMYNFVDTLVVGRGVSMDALAAVGLTGSLNFLVLGFIIGLSQGVGILCSQYFGSREYAQLRKSVTMSFYLNFSTGALLTVLSMVSTRQLLVWMNTPAELMADAWLYINVIFGGILISLAYNFLSGILRALGNSRDPLIAMIIAFIINTVLDVALVMGLGWGVLGAAAATVSAQLFSAIYCFVCVRKIGFMKLEKIDWKWNGELFRKSFVLSLPVAFMNSITALGVIFMQIAINGFGAVYIAAYSVASKIIIIFEQLDVSFGTGAGTFAGQNLGAGKPGRIREGIHQVNLLLIGINLAIFGLMLVAGRPLIGLMVGDQPAVIDAACQCIRFLTFFLMFLGTLWIYRTSLQSMSDTFWPMLSGVLEFAARTIALLILPELIGFYGVLSAEVSAWILAAIMLVIVYRRRIRVLEAE
ncbi:MATE family efflux transporter [Faecalibaculum rodentium]|jgi:putative MATE family efflux protein|uniref:MATE family efflux transporter n=1 Tax=Faecalibaculum rodentium TaxID=1702221 RepID=UPI00256F211C|nr:MATE family efflux transporter [Faecalibaculum rodentium]